MIKYGLNFKLLEVNVKKIWSTNHGYDMYLTFAIFLVGMVTMTAFKARHELLEELGSVIVLAILDLTFLIIGVMCVLEMLKAFKLEVKVNDFLFKFGTINWLDGVTPVYDFSARSLTSFVYGGDIYKLSGIFEKYWFEKVTIDDEVNVWVLKNPVSERKKMVVVEYRDEVSVYTN